MMTAEKKITRVAHLTSVHPLNDTRILIKECGSLSAAGYSVTLIVPHACDEMCGAVRVVATKRVRNRALRVCFGALQTLVQALKCRADLYHFHDPELIPVGMVLKLLGGKVIYDVHEDVPKQILVKHWIPSVIRKPLAASVGALERVAGAMFDHNIVVSDTIGIRFPAAKTTVVTNYPIEGELANSETPYNLRPKQVVYAGVIAKSRGAREMVAALAEVPADSGVTLALAGPVRPGSLLEDIQSLYPNVSVSYKGQLSRVDLSALLGNSRAGLVVIHPEPNHFEANPNKMFEYMSAGLPIIVSSFPYWKQLLSPEKCSLFVDPLNPKEIGSAIAWILENPVEAQEMGDRGRFAVRRRFNWEIESRKLLGCYSDVLK